MHPPISTGHLPAVLLSAPAPSTPLGPFEDSAVSWAFWVTLMAFTGLAALMALVAGPARALAGQAEAGIRTRLARAAVVAGVLALPAVLTELAHGDSGYDYGAAWGALFDGTGAGWEAGLQAFGPPAGALLLLPAALRRPGSVRAAAWARGLALGLGAVALGATKFPDAAPDDWGRESFDTTVWMLHLIGGGVWIGGLIGLLCLALPGAVPPAERAAFWGPAIRRFSAAAMSCVAAIGLSGLFLYWEHVDGLSQLLTTMYGRVLGVKILLFGGLFLLGGFNQFWLHPRIDALRAAGDARPLHTVLVRRFPAVVAAEVLLGLTLLFVAPFLHGSARNQAYQADFAKHATTATVSPEDLPRLPQKSPSTATWAEGTAETAAVILVMLAGYRYSAHLTRRRTSPTPTPTPTPVP